MFKEILSKLYDFAHDNDLYFEFRATNDVCSFVIQNRKRTWGYTRTITREEVAWYNGDPDWFADRVVDVAREKILRIGSSKEAPT